VQQHLVSGGVVFAACVKAAMHILNKVFDSDITLLASFVTAVDNYQQLQAAIEPKTLFFNVL